MNTYVTKELSRSLLEGIDPVVRNHLLSCMASRRRVVRFLCAPSGYGKTCLAYAYAKMAFGLHRFWWVDAGDPRFLLDLDDEGSFWTKVVSRTPTLLVFDGVPTLDDQRRQRLASLLAGAVRGGWEVVVTTADASLPGCYRRDRVVLDARDLALTDAEVSVVVGDARALPQAQRAELAIPACGFGQPRAHERFVASLCALPVTSRAEALQVLSLVVQGGSLAALQAVVPGDLGALAAACERQAPHCGIAASSLTYCPAPLASDERIELMRSQADRLAQVLGQGTQRGLVSAVVGLLRKKGEDLLAARLVARLLGEADRRRFLDAHAWDLLAGGAPLGVVELVQAVGERGLTGKVRVAHALSLAAVGERGRADEAFAGLLDQGLAREERVASLLLRSLVTPFVGHGWVREAFSLLEEADAATAGEVTSDVREGRWPQALCRVAVWSLGGPDRLAQLLRELSEAGIRLVQVAALAAYGLGVEALHLRQRRVALPGLGEALSEVLAQVLRAEMALMPANHVEHVLWKVVGARPGAGLASVEGLAHRVEVVGRSLSEQAAACQAGKVPPVPVPACLPARRAPQQERPAPTQEAACRLRVFGGFDLRSCDEDVSTSVHLRAKGKLFVSLLLINHGRELSRDWLERAIWPDVDASAARANFYALWSYVRRTATQACPEPFMVCTRETITFKDGVILTDLDVLERACRRLRDPHVGHDEYLELLATIRETYRGPLLPGVDNTEIEACRSAWTKRVVDAMLGAVDHLKGTGELRLMEELLSFAFQLDSAREDVCLELMDVRRLLGCHAAATSAFVSCQRTSLDRYGLGTSQRLKECYQQVLDEVS